MGTRTFDWLTDPHLDHLRDGEMLLSFVKKLAARKSDGLFITGDIASSHTIYDLLEIIAGAYQRPVYFVLGNHDYHGDWMDNTRKKVRSICDAVPSGILNWMNDTGVVMLNERTALVGHDGFYDGREGMAELSFVMPDFLPQGIPELAHAVTNDTLFERLQELGAASAAFLREQIGCARDQGAQRVVVLTHVPPFEEACYYKGKPSDERAVPFFTNQALGRSLLEIAEKNPDLHLEVLAGHTHGHRVYEAKNNLSVRVGRARYRHLPTWQKPVKI